MNQLADGTLVQIRTASMARDLNYYEPSRHIFLADKKSLDTHMLTQDHLPYMLSFFVPTQEVLRGWLEKEHGMYIELIMDRFGNNDEYVSEDISYRAFIWRVGHPRPKPHEDLGCSDRTYILEVALEHCLETLLHETQPKNRHLKDYEYNRI